MGLRVVIVIYRDTDFVIFVKSNFRSYLQKKDLAKVKVLYPSVNFRQIKMTLCHVCQSRAFFSLVFHINNYIIKSVELLNPD